MGQRLFFILSLIGIILISGCAAPGPGSYQQSMALDEWLETTAVPYLQKEMGENPMFKNQPFLIVSMNKENVEAVIDELTSQLREQAIDGLLRKPGVNLVWRPSAKPWEHHRSLTTVECAPLQKEAYYIGFDVGFSSIDNLLHVKIRALNLLENKWVTGFGISWKGTPTSSQKAALERKHPDDFLLGLRPLPFNSQQSDLLAAYMAHNLSCLFTTMELDEIIVHVRQENPDNIVFFDNSLGLVKKYLAKFREVMVTEDPSKANILVKTTVHHLHEGLYQVWITAMYKKGKTYVPGRESETYVVLEKPKKTVSAPAEVKRPSHEGSSSPVVQTPSRPHGDTELDVCFRDYLEGFDRRVFPMLQQYGDVLNIEREFNLCPKGTVCICYKVTVRTLKYGMMEKLMGWLAPRLESSDNMTFEMIQLSPSLLEVRFSRGFD